MHGMLVIHGMRMHGLPAVRVPSVMRVMRGRQIRARKFAIVCAYANGSAGVDASRLGASVMA